MSDIMEDEEWLEAMTPREMRHLIRTLQADLKRAVADRSVLMTALWSIARQADRGLSGLEPVQLLSVLRNIEVTTLNTVYEVEKQ